MRVLGVFLLAVLVGCGGGEGGSGSPAPLPAPAQNPTIGGVVSGLSGTVVLRNNGADDLSLSANGTFTFATAQASGSAYAVTVRTQPEGQACTVGSGSGTATASVSTIAIACAWQVATTLPMLRVTTTNGVAIISKDVYVTGAFELLDAAGARQAGGTLEIRGRGNSTWNYPKKPYRLKLTDSTALQGMPASKHWVLLANYLDKTLVRNELAFEMSRRVGMAWTPRDVQVVLELNGAYLGIYMLTEHIRIAPDRVDIPELKKGDTGPDVITGGYLMEADNRKGEDYCRRTIRGVDLCFANPETLLTADWVAQKTYIDGYIDELEAALYGPQFADPIAGYAAFMDVKSAIDFYLVHELFKNPDSNFFSSVFMYKKRGGKLTFGPVWDFDLAVGNAQWARYGFFDGSDPTGWHTRKQDTRVVDAPTNWYVRLFQDPAFEQRVRARWAELRAAGAIDGLFPYIDRRAAWVGQAQIQNFQRWDVLNTVLTPDLSPVRGPYDVHVQEMKSWLQRRVTWMNDQLR
ncbi:MAG: hypothetical protein RL030_1951 [Pseudomonadota bacterium]|jgi:hypothetical protein